MSKYIATGLQGNVGVLLQNEFDSIREYTKTLENINGTIFMHLASKSNGSWQEIVHSNINYLCEVIEFCRIKGIKKIIFFSAISIYSQEDLYSTSKLLGEKILKESGLQVLVLRLPMILTLETQNGILNRIIHKLQKDDEIILYNYDKKFNNFISVKEICDFIKEYKFKNDFEIVNLATSKEMTLYEIVEFMKAFLSSKSKITLEKGCKPLLEIDVDRLRNEFNYKPQKVKNTLHTWLEKRGKYEYK